MTAQVNQKPIIATLPNQTVTYNCDNLTHTVIYNCNTSSYTVCYDCHFLTVTYHCALKKQKLSDISTHTLRKYFDT